MNTLETIAPAFADAAVRGAVVLLIALALTHLMRRRSAAARHLVWVGAIAVQLLLPVFAIWGPKWDVAVPGAVASVSPVAIPERSGVRSSETTVIPDAPQVTTQTPSVTAPPIVPKPAPITRGQVLLLIWALGAAVVLVRLAAGTAIVARLARRGNRVDDGNWLSLAQRVSTSLQIDRPLTLLRGAKLGVPVTWGIVYPVVLLPDDSDTWPEERRKFVLVHEMAHVKRFDALTQLAGQLALALFWFDPLVWIANRRMQMEREHACDDYVLRHGTNASTYAEELLAMVRSLGTTDRSSQPAFAALAMARRSEFEGRMLSILDPVLDRHPLSKVRTFASALAALVLVVPLAALQPYQRSATTPTSSVTTQQAALPESFKISITADAAALAQKTAGANITSDASCDNVRRSGSKSGTSTHIHADDDGGSTGITDFLTFDAARCSSATIVGRLVYTAAEDDVAGMPFGAHAAFRQKTATDDHELALVRAQDGGIQRMYRRNGQPAAWDDDARKWFAGYLPSVLMEAGINVAPRVARWRAEGNVSGVLAHIAAMAGPSARRSHYEALLAGGGLSGDDLDRIVRSAAENMKSSGDLRAILMKAAPNVRLSRQSMLAIENALTTMGSSGDKTAVLQAYGQTDDREMLLAVMRATVSIASSGDRARLLQTLAPRYLAPGDRALERAFFEQVDLIPSSGDMRMTLISVLPHAARSAPVARQALESTRKVASSGDRSDVLIAMVPSGALSTKELRDLFFSVASEVPADGDRARVLQAAASLMR